MPLGGLAHGSLGSTMTATLWYGRRVRPCVVPPGTLRLRVKVALAVQPEAGPGPVLILVLQFRPSSRSRGREGPLVHVLEILDGMTWALSLVPMAMFTCQWIRNCRRSLTRRQ